MKKLLFFLLPFLLLAGCGNKQECLDYRDTYYDYVKDKQNVSEIIPIDVEDKIDWIEYTDLDEFTMFYSKVEDKCIAAYHITKRFPATIGHVKGERFYIYDALNDKEIKSWDWWRKMRFWYENDIEYYRTWKGELTWWTFTPTVNLEWYWRM